MSSTNAETLALYCQARDNLLQDIAKRGGMVEVQIRNRRIRRDTPSLLLAELEKEIKRYQALVAAEANTSNNSRNLVRFRRPTS